MLRNFQINTTNIFVPSSRNKITTTNRQPFICFRYQNKITNTINCQRLNIKDGKNLFLKKKVSTSGLRNSFSIMEPCNLSLTLLNWMG